jgi:hypothetical protein
MTGPLSWHLECGKQSASGRSVSAFLKVPTFGTFLLGAMGVVAGLLGMNFRARFFESARRRKWI